MHSHARRRALTASAASLAALSWPALGQTAWPSRQVRFIVPFPPGGPVDVTARTMSQKLGELWGQTTLVDNRAGAGGMVGAEFAAKQAADGYTVFVCSIHHSVLPSLKPKLPYDIERDFAPVSFGAMFPVVLVAHPSVPVKTVADVIALAKQQPGKLNFGSAGNGGGTHLAGELFNMQAGVSLTHVPYKGSVPAMTDLLGGQVQFMFSDAPTALPQIKAGRVRAIGVASAQRSALLPDVPTISDSGVPGYEAYSWAAVVVPASTPKDIVNRLSADITKVMSQPEVKQRLYDAGAEAMPTTPERFGEMLRGEISKWAKVVKAANIQAD